MTAKTDKIMEKFDRLEALIAQEEGLLALIKADKRSEEDALPAATIGLPSKARWRREVITIRGQIDALKSVSQ